jgi:flotillin
MYTLTAVSVGVVVLVVLLISVLSRYKRCPSDKILVIFGKVAKGQTAHCIHGGAAFVWPIIQDYKMLDLTPIQINIPLDNALSKQNIRVAVPAVFTIGISTKPETMVLAAERLLALSVDQIKEMAGEIIIGQMRLVVAQMDIEEINSNRDKFLDGIFKNVETELEKVGLRLINVNIQDIKDASGYLDALGKNAAAEAINNAKKAVAEKDRDGAIGQAEAVRDQTIKVANATAASESGKAEAQKVMRVNVANANAKAEIGEAIATQEQTIKVADATAAAESGKAEAIRLQRVNVAIANATAVEGENAAQITIANSTSAMRQKKAEAEKVAVASEKVQSAKALEEAYKAEQVAETARAERERATKTANEIVQADIDRRKVEIAAEAQKAKQIKEAEGEGEATYAKLNGQARGIFEILTKQAEGLQKIVAAAGGNPDKAATLLIIDKLPELVKTQVEAIKGIKIDKITVWDTGAQGDGVNSTAGFLQGLMKSVPPLNDLFKQAGMSLPEMLGKQATTQDASAGTPDIK